MIENENTDNSSLSSLNSIKKAGKIKIYDKIVKEEKYPELLKVISDILNDVCKQYKPSKDKKDLLAQPFESIKRPKVTIYEFMKRLYKFSKASEEILILVFIYIDRLSRNRKLWLNYYNIHKLILASFVATSKFYSDDYYGMDFYAKLGGISLREITTLEYKFLALFDFNLFVEDKLYNKYDKYLRNPELDEDDDWDYDSDD